MHFVKITGKTSLSPLPYSIGLPQGSLLGPDLFKIVINEITELLNWADTFLYADDSTIIYSDSSQTG